jgi:uncharacterized protein (TIGR00255 family)
MTGFGKAQTTIDDLVIIVEIKSLNGKQLDINLKISPVLKPYEFDIRNILHQSLLRGSLDVTFNISRNGSSKPMDINTELIRQYYQTLATLANELNISQEYILNALLKLPEAFVPSSEELTPKQWETAKEALYKALNEVDKHRINEGAILEKDLLLRIENIESYIQKISLIEPQRKEKIRQRLETALAEWMNNENIDKNRLEQELIFYIEKMDISEEQVRLANHCQFFKEVLKENRIATGKKLNFILQEIGREINTTGAKANNADLQRWVVKMKDELEKAKEQIMNVL